MTRFRSERMVQDLSLRNAVTSGPLRPPPRTPQRYESILSIVKFVSGERRFAFNKIIVVTSRGGCTALGSDVIVQRYVSVDSTEGTSPVFTFMSSESFARMPLRLFNRFEGLSWEGATRKSTERRSHEPAVDCSQSFGGFFLVYGYVWRAKNDGLRCESRETFAVFSDV